MVSQDNDAEVVISGIGGCFPKSDNIEQLKDLLMKNESVIGPARWKAGQMDICDLTGNVNEPEKFDASYFGIHRQQTLFMDPMSRLLLEGSFEAIMDAGINPTELRGKRIGVYMASMMSENDSLMFESVENGFGVTGQSRSMHANRISYWLNVIGPSYACDANWNGGMQVLQQAYETVKRGLCEGALIGGSNLAMNICPMFRFKQLGVTSPDAETRPFDEEANGYGRSEGICVFYIQRADTAKRNYASILNIDVLFNGNRPGGLGDFNIDNGVRFLEEFYKNAKVDPKDVPYVETYGCGVKILDEKEIEILDRVYNREKRSTPLSIGSVKSNVGHSEPASPLFGIVKVIIAMETGIIPANLNYVTPNKNISALVDGRIQVIDKNTPWDSDIAAVNSFGLLTSFGHILLKKNVCPKREYELNYPMLNILSTRTEEGIQEIIDVIKSNPIVDFEYSTLVNNIYSTTIPKHMFRGYLVRRDDENVKTEFMNFAGIKRPVWFVYSGMGSQWQTMGKDLMRLPIFAESIEKSHNTLLKKQIDLKHIITTDDKDIFNNILHSFVGIAAIQIAITDILKAIGIEPDGIIGHSVGELGCAYADGCLTAEQMILSAYYRGIASTETELIPGLMAAVGIGYSKMKDQCPPTIDIACHNGPESCTLSGPKEDMEKIVAELTEKGIFARLVNVAGIAYHSRYIKPAAPKLLEYLKELIPNPLQRSSKWLSSSVMEKDWGTENATHVSPEYLTNNLLSSVYFEEVLAHTPEDGVLIEIAPHGLLQAILKRSVSQGCTNIALTKRGEEHHLEFLLAAIGKVYLTGVPVTISNLYPSINGVVSRGTKTLSSLVKWAHAEKWRTGVDEFKKGHSNAEHDFILDLHSERFRDILGHCVDLNNEDTVVIPATAFLTLVSDMLSKITKLESVTFHNISILRQFPILSITDAPEILIMLQNGTGNFEISYKKQNVITGRINQPESFADECVQEMPICNDQEVMKFKLDGLSFYKELECRGYKFSGQYKSVDDIQVYKKGVMAKIKWNKNWSAFASSMIQMQMLEIGEVKQDLLMPVFIRKIVVDLENLPNEDDIEINVTHNYDTNITSSTIVQIHDIQFKPFNYEDKEIVTENYKFINYFNDDIPDLQTGINIIMQIIQQNPDIKNSKTSITELRDASTKTIENCIKTYCDVFVNRKIDTCIIEDDFTVEQLPKSTLLIAGILKIPDIYLYLNDITKYVLLCLPEAQHIDIQYPTVSVFTFKFGKFQYYLLKKIYNESPTVLNTKAKMLNRNDLTNTSINWVSQLHFLLNNKEMNDDKRIYLVSRVLPVNGVDNFLNSLRSLPNGKNIRLIVVLDESVPECSKSEKFYYLVFQQDLLVTIFKNGKWGSYFTVPYKKCLKNNDTDEDNKLLLPQHISKALPCKIKCIGYNTNDLMSNLDESNSVKIGLVDYSGIDATGKRIMGIARRNLETGNLEADPDFKWTLPDHINFVDGATIPYVYSLAYYVLMELVYAEPRDDILIHNGASNFGQALINIAFYIGCNIYTTVESELQKIRLLPRMLMLSEHQILCHNDKNWERDLMDLTQGKGVAVLINCLPGKKLENSVRMLTTFSRVIHIVPENSNAIDYNKTLGMSVFFNCIRMFGVRPTSVCDLPSSVKSRIREYIVKGMDNGAVAPLYRNFVRSEQNVRDIVKYLRNPKIIGSLILKLDDKKSIKNEVKDVNINKKKSYIIYGDDSDTALKTVQWLSEHKAKYIHIVLNVSKIEKDYIHRRILQLKRYYNVLVTLSDARLGFTRQTVREVQSKGPISAVLVLPLNQSNADEQAERMLQADEVLATTSPATHLVCLWGHTKTHICHISNRMDSQLCSNICWERSVTLNDILAHLSDALENHVDIFVRGDKIEEDVIKKDFSYKDFFSLLSTSTSSLCTMVNIIKPKAELTYIQSATPERITESPPLFIIPGLFANQCHYFNHLIQRIMMPTYMVNPYTTNQSIEEVAKNVVQGIQRIWPSGPYNIMGISIGGALAIEVTKILESITSADVVQLYLIDGMPSTIQYYVEEIEKDSKHEFELNLLRIMLHMSPENIRALKNILSWESRLNMAIQLLNYSKRDSAKLIRIMNTIKKQFDEVIQYKSPDRILNCTVRLLRSQESSDKNIMNIITAFFKQAKVEFIEGNHFTMLQSDELFQYINENIIVQPLYG